MSETTTHREVESKTYKYNYINVATTTRKKVLLLSLSHVTARKKAAFALTLARKQ